MRFLSKVQPRKLAAAFAACRSDEARRDCCRQIVAKVEQEYDNANTRLVLFGQIRKELKEMGVGEEFIKLVVLSSDDYEWRSAQHEQRLLTRQFDDSRHTLVPSVYLRTALNALKDSNPLVRLLGVQALTGRRNVEIYDRGEFEPSEYRGWGWFTGQAKTKDRLSERYLIPSAHPEGVEPVQALWYQARNEVREMIEPDKLQQEAIRAVKIVFNYPNTTMLRSAWAAYTHHWFGRPMKKLQWIACFLGHRADVGGVLVPDRETSASYDVWEIGSDADSLPPHPALPPTDILVPALHELAERVHPTASKMKPSPPAPEPAQPTKPVPAEPPAPVPVAPTSAPAPASDATQHAVAELRGQAEEAGKRAEALEAKVKGLEEQAAAIAQQIKAARAEAAHAREGADRLLQAVDVVSKALAAVLGGVTPPPKAASGVPAPSKSPAVAQQPAPAAAPVTPAGPQNPATPPVAVVVPPNPVTPPPSSQVNVTRRLLGAASVNALVLKVLKDGPMTRAALFKVVVAEHPTYEPSAFSMQLSRMDAAGQIRRSRDPKLGKVVELAKPPAMRAPEPGGGVDRPF